MRRALFAMAATVALAASSVTAGAPDVYGNDLLKVKVSLSAIRGKVAEIVLPGLGQSNHGFLVKIDGGQRLISFFVGWNTTSEANTLENFREALSYEQAAASETVSMGRYTLAGMPGFRALLVAPSATGQAKVVEFIRVLRGPQDDPLAVYFEVALESDREHYIDDANILSGLLAGFRLTGKGGPLANGQ